MAEVQVRTTIRDPQTLQGVESERTKATVGSESIDDVAEREAGVVKREAIRKWRDRDQVPEDTNSEGNR